MIGVTILGLGNVGSHLYKALKQRPEVELVQRYGQHVRNPEGKEENNWCYNLEKLLPADVYILAVPDDRIISLSKNLPFRDRLVVHTSGTVGLSDLESRNRRGVFYPLQTFSRDRPVDLQKVPFCLEAENANDLELLRELAGLLSDSVVELSSEKRLHLHLAAVIVNNFTNHLFHVAHQLLTREQIDFGLLKPLIRETVDKLDELTPRDAQTGPALRNDRSTMKKHVDLLQDSDKRELYKIMSSLIRNTYGEKL